MVNITEELPKIEKAEENLSHIRSHPKKKEQNEKGTFNEF
jgi:hypothetical protein